jgi:predicted Zn-dependent protease with MMP-like domain
VASSGSSDFQFDIHHPPFNSSAARRMSLPWPQLLKIAQDEVQRILNALPAPLRRQATPLPVTFERHPSPVLLAEEYDPDLLGLFVGSALAEPGEYPLPPQIILFLENLWGFAEEDEELFRMEIRTTYLHELGHYLGLDEIDLEERGLD